MTDPRLTAQGLVALTKARGWAHYLAFLGIAATCLTGLGLAIALIASTGRVGPPTPAPTVATMTVMFVVIGLSLAGTAIALRGYWKGAAAFLRGEASGLTQVASRMRWFLMVVVVGYAVMNLLSLIMVVADLFGHDLASMTPPSAAEAPQDLP